ncbi:adenine phosphoribosyltransferase [Flavobacteriaceae bacterium F89]|uniref:Adenine phosphoribosyltransferase n=1 Tax=Cerina litoralis TaxID=2874477 RepID=A0AAE3EWF9_9FLAO|nr:adenine phosphoribosyltransferase [Cerina litoralis]MCG2460961.1 adenine phosphoribosyltransferase [Cerina litoralis]
MDFKTYIRDIPDFPKDGVVFKDITTLLKDAKALKMTSEALCQMVGDQKVDKVVSMESRGFFFAPILGVHFNAGFVPVRKKGRLPAKTVGQTYNLEYGTDTLEIHADAISPGERVLIHDDVLATGGTALAVCQMIESMGAQVVQCNFLLELGFLEGRKKLEGFKVKSLISY